MDISAPLPPPPRETLDLQALLGPAGPVAAALAGEVVVGGGTGGYEARPQQLRMAEAVAAAFEGGRHLLVEAGTGVGKSFAYLVPALAWAARTGKVVAVATSTIALQEQLVRRDLPLLAEALPFPVSFALVKGRGNYLCTRRLHLAREQAATLFPDDLRAQLEAIEAWRLVTEDGSRQDLPFQPPEALWELVKAEQGNCLGKACPHYVGCHYQASRRRAHTAKLLVLNHHVLLADLALRRSGNSFLPEVGAIVVDEAHDLEETAAEHLGSRASSLGLAQVLGRLWNPRTKTGLLAKHPDPVLRVGVEAARRELSAFFEGLSETLRSAGSGADVSSSLSLNPSLPLPDPSPVPAGLADRLEALAEMLVERCEAADDRDVALEINARATGLRDAAAALASLAGVPSREDVRWVDLTARGVNLYRSPVEVGTLLQQVLWGRGGPVILTSATLTTGRPPSFAFVRRRLGLTDADELTVGSPFDFTRQARIVLRADLPDPAASPGAWEAALPDAVEAAIRESDGGALVLFTSYGSLRKVAATLRERLEGEGLEVLVQGESLERPALLARFRQGGAVLLGVASFWQGVDVPGDALRHVIIARLPFEVPTHPRAVARRNRVEAAGGDAFQDLTLPVTALRLKQGFGRLIRRATDSGMVTILDPRIVTKRYGRMLLDSLPECPTEIRRGNAPNLG